MEEQINLLSERIEWLEKLYDQTLQGISNSNELFWMIIIGTFAIIGIALYVIAQGAIKSGLEKGLKDTEHELNAQKKLILELSQNLIIQLELLNGKDHERGSWIPQLIDIHGIKIDCVSTGRYTRIKNKIFLDCEIEAMEVGINNEIVKNSQIVIGGLPFCIKNNFNMLYIGDAIVIGGSCLGKKLNLFAVNSLNYIIIYKDELTKLIATDIDKGFKISFSVIYDL